MVAETALTSASARSVPSTPSTIGIQEVQETARSILSVPSTSGIREVQETAPDTSIESDKEAMTEPLFDTSLSDIAKTQNSGTTFKRPASPVKFAAKKSTKFDNFDDDDDDDGEDLFNFDDVNEETVSSQRKRKRSDEENNVKPCKKEKVSMSPPPPTAPISVVEEVTKVTDDKKSPIKRTFGFLSKSIQSNTSSATVVKSEIPEEDLTRSFITLEVRSLVAKKSNSISRSTISPQNGNVKNVKRFRKQLIAQANSPISSRVITSVSARTFDMDHTSPPPLSPDDAVPSTSAAANRRGKLIFLLDSH